MPSPGVMRDIAMRTRRVGPGSARAAAGALQFAVAASAPCRPQRIHPERVVGLGADGAHRARQRDPRHRTHRCRFLGASGGIRSFRRLRRLFSGSVCRIEARILASSAASPASPLSGADVACRVRRDPLSRISRFANSTVRWSAGRAASAGGSAQRHRARRSVRPGFSTGLQYFTRPYDLVLATTLPPLSPP